MYIFFIQLTELREIKQSLIQEVIGEVNDLDHMISLDTVKKKISKILLNLRFLLMILFNVFFVTLFFFFLELNIKLSILLSDVFHDLLCICQNYLNQFFVNFSLMGVRQIFSYITSFCILSFLI